MDEHHQVCQESVKGLHVGFALGRPDALARSIFPRLRVGLRVTQNRMRWSANYSFVFRTVFFTCGNRARCRRAAESDWAHRWLCTTETGSLPRNSRGTGAAAAGLPLRPRETTRST